MDRKQQFVNDNRENLLKTAAIEANSVISFFNSNGLVNNADKAAVQQYLPIYLPIPKSYNTRYYTEIVEESM